MYTCIIVDDQEHAVNLMKKHVLKIPQLSIMLTATDSIEALTFLDNNKPDIIFLDVEMPGIDGIEFTQSIKIKWGNDMPKIVFTTGHTDYALSGYEHGIADYLLKPITFSRFKQCTDRIIVELDKRSKISEQAGFFFADNEGGKVRIDIEEIIYIEGKGNYISIYTTESDKILYKSMNAMQDFLPVDKFVRVHKSYLVSINKIRSVKGNEIIIKVKNIDKSIPLGVTFKDNVLKQLGIS